MAHQSDVTQPGQFVFKDDGAFPNSRLPLLLYRRALVTDGKDPASIFEERLRRTIGLIRGETASILFLIITAPHMKCLAFTEVAPSCYSVASMERLLT
jgi:hypothetical protein